MWKKFNAELLARPAPPHTNKKLYRKCPPVITTKTTQEALKSPTNDPAGVVHQTSSNHIKPVYCYGFFWRTTHVRAGSRSLHKFDMVWEQPSDLDNHLVLCSARWWLLEQKNKKLASHPTNTIKNILETAVWSMLGFLAWMDCIGLCRRGQCGRSRYPGIALAGSWKVAETWRVRHGEVHLAQHVATSPEPCGADSL